MRLFKVSFMLDDRLQGCDGVEYEGKLWLVTLLSANKEKGLLRIDRLVRFDNLPFQNIKGSQFGDYGLNVTLPKALFDLDLPQIGLEGYEIIDDPEIELPLSARS